MRKEPVTFLNQCFIALKNENLPEDEALSLAIKFLQCLKKDGKRTDIFMYLGGDPAMKNIH